MKKIHLSSLLFVLFSVNSLAQEIQTVDTTKWLCTYNYEYMQDSTNLNSMRKDLMYLQIGSHMSKFDCVTHFITDSVNYSYQGKNADIATVALMGIKSTSGMIVGMMSLYDIFKNYPRKGLMIFTAFDDHKFYKVEQPMQMDWKLDAQKDTMILGYSCQKAYTSYAGRDYVAWYSLQVPVNDGPYKFNGLPGLILKVSDTKNQHCFTLTSIKKLNYFRTINYHLSDYVNITAEEYVKIMRSKMIRLFEAVQNGSVPISNEEAKARSMNSLRTKNNFIEKF